MIIYVPENTSAAKLAALALEFDDVSIETHEHTCASIDDCDEIVGCRALSVVNDILWPQY